MEENNNKELIKIELSLEELLIINNALNEILHGPAEIDEVEFHTRIGVKKSDAKAFLDKIRLIASFDKREV